MRQLKAAAVRAALSTFCSFILLATAYARADEPAPRPFDISPQSLATALSEFARQSQQEILFAPEVVAQKLSSGVRGTMQPLAALKLLLKDSALTFTTTEKGAVLVGAPPSGGTTPVSSGDEKVAPKATGEGATKENRAPEGTQQKSMDDRIRTAQVEQGVTAGDSSVGKQGNTQNDARPRELDQIIVTAQKRTEMLSKAPMAVSALDMSQLQDAGVVNIKDLTSAVPDVQIHTIGLDSFVGINIRGISNYDYSGKSDPAVSTYIDGVYVGLSQGFATELYDLQRVEVLRGPQGTLYGRNATGGNVNVITADPKPSFSAAADVSYGNYNDVQTHGMVNVRLTDELFIRAAFITHRNDGYFDTRGYTARNYGASDDFGGRLTALWTPSGAFKWRLSIDDFISEGTPWASIDTGADGKPLNGLPVYKQPVSSDPEPENYIRSSTIRSRMDWNITDSLTASYVAGYQVLDTHYSWATTGNLSAPATPAWVQYDRGHGYAHSHELDVNYDSNTLKNVFGGSYYLQEGPRHSTRGIFNAIALDEKGDQPSPGIRKKAWGIFEQATYSLIDHLRITGGLRYSKESQVVDDSNVFYCSASTYPGLTLLGVAALTAASPGCSPSNSPSGSGSWSNVSWKAGIEGDISDRALAYLSVTTGFKSGGLQPNVRPGISTTYRPEEVRNYELGFKTRLFDDSANVRVALFYEDYTDLQVFQLVSTPQGISLVTTNAAKAGIYGTEIEGEWNLSPVDHIRGFVNYLHATYTNYKNTRDPLTNEIVASLDGNQLPNAPQESIRLQYSHDFTLPNNGTVTPQAAVYWQSFSYLNAFNDSYFRVNPYTKTDLSLTYADPSGRWKLAAYVDNLEDHAVRTGEFTGAGVYSDFAPPRLFGVRISYQQ